VRLDGLITLESRSRRSGQRDDCETYEQPGKYQPQNFRLKVLPPKGPAA
jgi:hypothetical protein